MGNGPVGDDLALLRAKALGDVTRARIHRLISESAEPITVAELTAAIGLHHTAVRQHVAKLVAAGLVGEEVLPPTGRGRPRLAYRSVRTGRSGSADDPYRMLAALLAEAVRTGRTAREVGRLAGARGAPLDALVGAPVDAVVAAARRFGFDPAARRSVDGSVEVELRTCPYADLADTDPATVCSLHVGLAEGLAATVGGGLIVDGLVVSPSHRGGCVLRLRQWGMQRDDGNTKQPTVPGPVPAPTDGPIR